LNEEEERRKKIIFRRGEDRHGRATFGMGRGNLLVFVCFGQVIRHGRALIGTTRAKASGD